jgi:hypothetical protein
VVNATPVSLTAARIERAIKASSKLKAPEIEQPGVGAGQYAFLPQSLVSPLYPTNPQQSVPQYQQTHQFANSLPFGIEPLSDIQAARPTVIPDDPEFIQPRHTTPPAGLTSTATSDPSPDCQTSEIWNEYCTPEQLTKVGRFAYTKAHKVEETSRDKELESIQ